MCRVCEMKKEQERPIKEIGRLMAKREKAILMGNSQEAQEIKPIIVGLFEEMLAMQDKLPSLLETGDVEVIVCLLTGGERKHDIAARRV